MFDFSNQLSRRQMLQTAGGGFGAIGLAGALGSAGLLAAGGRSSGSGGGGDVAADVAARRTAAATGAGGAHFTPRAQRVIFLFMNGGPSHVDTFDPKPALAEHAGEQPGGKLERASKGSGYMPSPFRFAPQGESGVVMSELFPRLAGCADDLCVVRSMHADQPNHEPGLLIMNSGNPQPIRPCLGSWLSYGLGSENANLPAFVAICPGMPVIGPQLWSSSFLPGEHQGLSVDSSETAVDKLIANIRHPRLPREEQRRQVELWLALNRRHQEQRPHDAALEAQIRSMELAFQMQREAADAFDLSQETAATQDLYGDSLFGRSVLLARRLSERGVRCVQVYYVSPSNKQPWDTHANNNSGHEKLCADSDRATAALLVDLKQRGLLDDTLVVWGGEFGRTPYSQEDKSKDARKAGRDHHCTGFSMLLAGGGVRGGLMYGATDEFGMHAVENRVHVHDLHATLLHLLGLDHTRLTYRYSGRDFRLTDIHGRVVSDILA